LPVGFVALAVIVAPGATAIGAVLPFNVRAVVDVGVEAGAVEVPTVIGALVPKRVRESLANSRASYVPAGVVAGIV